MPNYAFLLVLALAASTVAPVLSVDAPEPSKKEGRASSHFKPVERRVLSIWNDLTTKDKLKYGSLMSAEVLLIAGAIYGVARISGAHAAHNSANVPTNTTQETPTPSPVGTIPRSNTPRAIFGPGERPLGHRLPVDNSKAKEFLDNNDLDRRTSPHLDLLSRADLEDALSIFSRMLDRLD